MGLLSTQEIELLERVLVTNPKAKKKIAGAIKEAVPEWQMPADVIQAEEQEKAMQSMFDEKVKPLNDTIEKLQAELSKKEKDDEWSKQVEKLKKVRGWNDKQLTKFMEDLQEEFKERRAMTLEEMAEYHELKNRPLTPSQSNPSFFGSRGETETEWRQAVRDPNSDFMKAVRSKDNRKKKEIKSKWWKQAGQEWADQQRSQATGI